MEKSSNKESSRSSSLLDLAIDYNENDSVLSGFSELACLASGAMYSQINLIDDENQWTVAECGMNFDHIPVEQSVCFVTINREDVYEIKDFTSDPDFKDHPFVTNSPFLKYYLGFPFTDENGVYIGTICLLHTETLDLSENQMHSLSVMSEQISAYLNHKKELANANSRLIKQDSLVTKIRHDIRGPLSGIIGFASLIEEEITDARLLRNLGLIKQSSKNLLEYAEQSLTNEVNNTDQNHNTDIGTIIERIKSLYAMQSKLKDIDLDFENRYPEITTIYNLAPNHLINIVGNVVSNAIKFSPNQSNIKILIDDQKPDSKSNEHIMISVTDNGPGIPADKLQSLNNLEVVDSGQVDSDSRVSGFGIGLVEALRLLVKKEGRFIITSEIDKGTSVQLFFLK
ncbi:MAG: GAF domain-containing sensor histidine kinase [Balneola sp.]